MAKQLKRFLCVMVFVLAGFSSLAASPVFRLPGSSVWQIRKDGNTLFLGGSIHILRAEDFPLPREFDKAFSRSAMLVLEADTPNEGDMDFVLHLMERMFLPEGETLRNYLDEETYAALMAKSLEFGIQEENIFRLKPSLAVNMLAVMEMEANGFVEEGVDFYFQKKAKEKNMPVEFLEELEVQINMLLTMGDGYENDFVRYSLADMGNTRQGLETMVLAWKTGDVEYEESSLMEMKTEWPILYKTLLVDRNNAWLPQLEAYLTTSPVEFIVVGLAHLYGPDGLLQQLKDKGYVVEQFH